MTATPRGTGRGNSARPFLCSAWCHRGPRADPAAYLAHCANPQADKKAILRLLDAQKAVTYLCALAIDGLRLNAM